MLDFYRACAIVPEVSVADTEFNKNSILEKINEAYEYNPAIIATPELAITGYSCQDLFFQSALKEGSREALGYILESTVGRGEILIVGAPLYLEDSIYNAAFVMSNGRLLGISVKTFIPNHCEFYEKRWFSSAEELPVDEINFNELGILYIDEDEDYPVPVGNNLIYDINSEIKIGIEICEDLWSPAPPSTRLALGGAEIIVNLSASNETISKRDYRRSLVKHQSASSICDYLYVSAGATESTQDLVFSGHSILAENGILLNENRDYIARDYIMIADMDLGRIRHDRLLSGTFKDASKIMFKDSEAVCVVKVENLELPDSDGEYLMIQRNPFIPSAKTRRLKRCNEIFDMQVYGLVKRLEITGARPVVGVSGGMDSTLALLVCARALRKMKRDPGNLVAITMPAFGTTDRTYNNSIELIKALGTEPIVINIKASCEQHLKDLGRDLETHDITFENTQARERTQVLMDYANACNGIVVGTGDLSELALGWCTYNGDQMSMYNVNGSIPKTLVRWMIDSVVENEIFPDAEAALRDILDTPISPELLPPDKDGNISQKTEESVGPYELHDFFIYYSLRLGYGPEKIFYLARKVFSDTYDDETILKWMKMYFRRLFSQQFKRSCMADGVKVGSVSMSPRGDLRMPSDASSKLWMDELEKL